MVSGQDRNRLQELESFPLPYLAEHDSFLGFQIYQTEGWQLTDFFFLLLQSLFCSKKFCNIFFRSPQDLTLSNRGIDHSGIRQCLAQRKWRNKSLSTWPWVFMRGSQCRRESQTDLIWIWLSHVLAVWSQKITQLPWTKFAHPQNQDNHIYLTEFQGLNELTYVKYTCMT